MRASVKRPGLIWPSLVTLAAVTALVTATGPARAAQAPCNTRATVLTTLEKDYGEKPVAFGITGKGSMVQVIAAKDGKTWTIVIHDPSGTSCLIAAGQTWRVRTARGKVSARVGGPR